MPRGLDARHLTSYGGYWSGSCSSLIQHTNDPSAPTPDGSFRAQVTARLVDK